MTNFIVSIYDKNYEKKCEDDTVIFLYINSMYLKYNKMIYAKYIIVDIKFFMSTSFRLI